MRYTPYTKKIIIKIFNKNALELKYKEYYNAKYIYRWHTTEKWYIGIIVMQLGRFLTRECLLK